MQDTGCTEYFRRRADQERTAADQATDERAALTHREMAGRYDELARGIVPVSEAEPPPLRPGILPRDFQIVP